jgi:hypothetical protein
MLSRMAASDLHSLLQQVMAAIDFDKPARAKELLHWLANQIAVHTDQPRYDASARKANAGSPE